MRYEVARRLNRYRSPSGYRFTHRTIGEVHRVVLRGGGRERSLDLRAGTSDFPLLCMTFGSPQYDIAGFARHADVRARYDAILAGGKRPLIVDAGANIGLASLYFRDQYPDALIVAVEPEPGNFAMLRRLLADDPLAVPMQAALADFDGTVQVTDPGLGDVGFRTTKAEAGVPAYRLESIVERARTDHDHVPFILKVDIEGFERDLFASPDAFDQFYLSFIELHDWMLPRERTSASFLRMVAPLDRDFILHGENVVSIRNADPMAVA